MGQIKNPDEMPFFSVASFVDIRCHQQIKLSLVTNMRSSPLLV